MKAITFESKDRLALRDVPEPTLDEPTDVIVKTRLTAICGSDLHVASGREEGIDAGTPMGHEFLGEVVAVGAEVQGLSEGDVVVSPFTTNCGSCPECRRGLTCRCTTGELYGWVENGVGLPGAQAEYVRVPFADHTAVKVPDGVDEESALFLGDILSTGFFCADMASAGPEKTHAVLGCGPVGLFAVVGARELGAERIYALDRVPERLALAEAFGATPVHIGDVDPRELLLQETEGRGADAVLEVVGSPQASRLAIDLVRPGGTIAAVGVHTEPQFAFSPAEAYDKNLTYRAGRCPARHYMERLLPLVESGRYDLRSIVTHRLPLEEEVNGYEMFANKRDGCVKVLLTP